MAAFFFFFFRFYTYLITLLCPSSAPPFPRSARLLPILRLAIPPPLFHFLFKWLHPHCFVCLERPGSGSPGILLLPRSCGGWSERGAARVNGGEAGGGGEPRGGCQMCQRRSFQFTRRGRRGTSRAERPEMGGLVFLDGYILSTCRPPENNSEGDLRRAAVSALLLRRWFGFWGNLFSISCM